MNMIPFFIVCPLVFLAGFIDSIAGGGGLISLPAFLLAGLNPYLAIGTNKLSSAFGTTISTARYCKNGYVNIKAAAVSIPAALIGSSIGSSLVLLVDENIIKYIILFALPIVAFYVLKNKNLGTTEITPPLSPEKLYFICIMASFFVGMYDGFYGPGTGTFLLLIYTGLGRMDIKSASGNTKIINLSSNIAAVIVFILKGQVKYSLGLAAAAFCIAGHYIGSGMVLKNGYKIVRPIVLVVLGSLFIKIISGK